MRATTRIQPNGQVAIPNRVREQAGLAKGDLVEFTVENGKIVITPKTVVRPVDDEYTPEQRQAIDARLAKSEADFRAGRTHGPFNTADEAIGFLRQNIKRKVRERKQQPR